MRVMIAAAATAALSRRLSKMGMPVKLALSLMLCAPIRIKASRTSSAF
jgi:hypothetical protein